MCFSASASFVAGSVLTVIGIASIRKAESSAQKAFAGIPFIFALQQITEGFLWLSLGNSGYASLQWPATYIFLFFAQVVWPFWVPFAIMKLEKDRMRKKIMTALTVTGAVVSCYLAFCLLAYPVEASIEGLHISYEQAYPAALSRYGGLLYIIATIGPTFVSSVRKMWALGTAIFISYMLTAIFYTDYIVSVWCFFAAIISIGVVGVLFEMERSSGTLKTSGQKRSL